jgi:hypothetical protein
MLSRFFRRTCRQSGLLPVLALAAAIAVPAVGNAQPYSDEGDLLSEEEAIAPADSCVSSRVPGFRTVFDAPVDECFTGVGVPPVPPRADGSCPIGSTPRKNYTYAWGMTEEGGNLFFAGSANPVCSLLNTPEGAPSAPPLVSLQTGTICEFGRSASLTGHPERGNLGDWRAPRIWRMNTCTLEREEITPTGDINLQDAVGLRSAGSFNDVAFFAGPAGAARNGRFDAASNGDGIVMFAFEASTGQFLGSQYYGEYNNIRQWLVAEGVLYTGVTRKVSEGGGGDILRWRGTKESPFQFEIVGRITTAPANMALHNGRLFLSTWPNADEQGNILEAAGVVMGPRIGSGGLTSADRNLWQIVWSVTDFEPDPAVANGYGLGVIRSWRGDLYWGTMHFPAAGLIGHRQAHGDTWRGPVGLVSTFIATTRSASVFRGVNFGIDGRRPTVQTLYADPVVPVWNGRRFVLRRTLGGLPRFGPGGFGWWFNSYIWQGNIAQGSLFLSTFDISDMYGAFLEAVGNATGNAIPNVVTSLLAVAGTNPATSGADMWRFRIPGLPPQPVTFNGGGNPAQFGFRTMVSGDDHLWLGTAGGRGASRNGGLKIIRFQPTPTVIANPPDRNGILPWLRWFFTLPLRLF